MADIVSPEKRSQMMAGIKGRDTRPEMLVRRALHARGYRFRLHRKDLPGKPDIVLPKYRVAIFVHGCFWHGHGCHLFKWPTTREDFWREKIGRNRERDAEARTSLIAAGWRILVVWECALRRQRNLSQQFAALEEFVQSKRSSEEIGSGCASQAPDQLDAMFPI